VACVVGDVDLQSSSAEQEPEAETGQPGWQVGVECEVTVVVAHAPEATDGNDPGAGERGNVEAVAGVVFGGRASP
jgi:hypothetical protein